MLGGNRTATKKDASREAGLNPETQAAPSRAPEEGDPEETQHLAGADPRWEGASEAAGRRVPGRERAAAPEKVRRSRAQGARDAGEATQGPGQGRERAQRASWSEGRLRAEGGGRSEAPGVAGTTQECGSGRGETEVLRDAALPGEAWEGLADETGDRDANRKHKNPRILSQVAGGRSSMQKERHGRRGERCIVFRVSAGARDRDPERAFQAGHRGTASRETRAGPTHLGCEATGRSRLTFQTLRGGARRGPDAERGRGEAVLAQETGGRAPGIRREPQEGSLTWPSHPDCLLLFNKCVCPPPSGALSHGQ